MRQIIGLVLLHLLLADPASAQEATAGVGIGTQTCSHFAKKYKENPAMAELVFFTWTQGFMTGQNVESLQTKGRGRDLKAKPVGEQEAFLRSYCNSNPLADYWIAALALYESLPLKTVQSR